MCMPLVAQGERTALALRYTLYKVEIFPMMDECISGIHLTFMLSGHICTGLRYRVSELHSCSVRRGAVGCSTAKPMYKPMSTAEGVLRRRPAAV